MFKYLILIFLLGIINMSFAQTERQAETSILIYSDDNGYMQPFIENTLENLENVDSERLYFTSVNSFNRFINHNNYQAQMSDLLVIHKPLHVKLNPYYSESEKQIRERIFNILRKYDYFLTIKTNTLGELIEFQFQLFKTASDNSTFNISDKVLGIENFFINPKEKDYKLQITKAIQRLFKKSNRIPDVELKIYNKVYKASDSENAIILPMATSIILDGTASGDHDSEHLDYIWRNILNREQKHQTVKKIMFNDNFPKQEIVINEPGTYKIGFKVFDGVSYSKEVIIDISVKEKPKEIGLYNTLTYSKNYRGLLFNYSEKVFKGKVYIDQTQKDSLLNKIILTKEPITQKTKTEIEDDLIVPLSISNGDHLGEHYIGFESIFRNVNINERKKYYLYSVDNDGLLYNEKEIEHVYSVRNLIDLRIKANAGAIDIQGDGMAGGYPNQYVSLGVGFLLLPKLELELMIPITKRKEISYNGYRFKYPHTYELSLNYIFFKPNVQPNGVFEPLVGLSFKSYSLASENLKNKNSQATSLGFNIGTGYKIGSWRLFDLNMRVNINHEMILNSDLNKIKSTTITAGPIFRI